MKKSLKLIVLGSLLSTSVMGTVVFAADEIKPTDSEATASFADESTIDPTKTPLRFGENAVTKIEFGQIDIQGDTKSYPAIYNEAVLFQTGGEEVADAKAAPLNVTTVDNRGSLAGWTMQVAMTQQFKTTEDDYLKGATLSLTSTQALSTKAEEGRVAPSSFKEKVVLGMSGEGNDQQQVAQTVVTAEAGQGVGTWSTLFGDRIEKADVVAEIIDEGLATERIVYAKNDKVQLTVPGSIKKEEKAYTAKLTWSLLDTPETK